MVYDDFWTTISALFYTMGRTKEMYYPSTGYGYPTKGVYNANDKGWKTFGTVGQGELTTGCMGPED